MKFNFGQKLKSLRKQSNLTQEQLAEYFGVSFQAISKWETNAAYPDISMFPIIANFFKVTTDELLGVDVSKKNEAILELCNDVDQMFKENKYPQALLLLRKAVIDYPGNEKLLYRLAWALTGNIKENTAYLDEAIKVYLKILEFSDDTELRLKITRDLIYRYYTKNDISTAIAYANQLPPFEVCREYTIGRSNLLEGKDLADYLKSNISLFGNAILECLEYFINDKIISEQQMLPETVNDAKKKIKNIMELFK